MNMSGLYKIVDDSNQTFQVFCDFDSEPEFAWNLIQSFSLSNKHYFEVIVVRAWQGCEISLLIAEMNS